MRYPSEDVARFDQQFAETAEEKAERRQRHKLAKLQKQCDDWNAVNPIGTRVIVKKDVGTNVHTKTRSEAQVLSGHSAVVWLEGIAGCYGLDRVSRE